MKHYVTASEIGDYVYCKRSWWLKTKGLRLTTSAMIDGEKNHSRIFFWANMYKKLLIFALSLMLLGLVLGIIASIYFYQW